MSEVSRLPRKFDPKNFNADHSGLKSTIWTHDLDEHESFQDCLDYNNYSRVMASRTPQQGDFVIARNHDRSNVVQHLVLATDKAWLKLRPFLECVRPDVIVPETSSLSVKWNVGKRKYDVIRKSDNAVLHAGFSLKEDAVKWIDEHTKLMAA